MPQPHLKLAVFHCKIKLFYLKTPAEISSNNKNQNHTKCIFFKWIQPRMDSFSQKLHSTEFKPPTLCGSKSEYWTSCKQPPQKLIKHNKCTHPQVNSLRSLKIEQAYENISTICLPLDPTSDCSSHRFPFDWTRFPLISLLKPTPESITSWLNASTT